MLVIQESFYFIDVLEAGALERLTLSRFGPPDLSTDENLSNTKVLFIIRSDFLYYIFVRPNGRTYIWAAL